MGKSTKVKEDGYLNAEYKQYKSQKRVRDSFSGFRLTHEGSNDDKLLFVGNTAAEAFWQFLEYTEQTKLNIIVQESVYDYLEWSNDEELANILFPDEDEECDCEDCIKENNGLLFQIFRQSKGEDKKPCKEAFGQTLEQESKKYKRWFINITDLNQLKKLRDDYGDLSIMMSREFDGLIVIEDVEE